MANEPQQENGTRGPGNGRGLKATASVAGVLRRLWLQLPRRRRWQFGLLLLLTLAGAGAEMFALGALLPFLAVVANPSLAERYGTVAAILQRFWPTGPNSVLFGLTLAFCVGVLAASGIRILLAWANNRYAYMVGHELSVRLYDVILHQDYKFHTLQSSSTIIAGVQQVNLITTNVLMPTLQAISSAVIGAGIAAALIIVDKTISVLAFVGIGFIYIQISLLFRRRLKANSINIARLQSERVRAVQEGLGGIRDVLINATQPVFLSRFRTVDGALQRAQAANSLAGVVPRYGIEAIGMVVIAGLAYYLAIRAGGLGYALPMLGVLVLAAQRMLPLMQMIYYGWTLVVGSAGTADIVLTLLEAPHPAVEGPGAAPLPFVRDIALKNVSFRYSGNHEPSLRALNLKVRKGAKVGIVGETGSGKSTLTDLLMGLLEPTGGTIEIDGRPLDRTTRAAWQAEIAHVPQAIFLSDSTIAENIAFGIEPAAIDRRRLERAAEQAALGKFVRSLPDGYDTLVGERGIRLSGGERQRIGIARALYKRADVIFFDEATSALDVETERAVINSIRDLDPDLTVFIVAHRLTAVEHCDIVVTLRSGQPSLSIHETASRFGNPASGMRV
jgi:ABC-type multidrug transport system fused ATPase/permease subunit